MKQQELYRYYSTQRPVDIGTYPKDADNPLVGFLNYDDRISVEHGAYRAWGEVIYRFPLTPEQIYAYELRPARDNPDVRRTMKAQAQVVGRWEDNNRIPPSRRLTQCVGISNYTFGDRVTPEQLAGRYRLAEDTPSFPAGAPGLKSPLKLRGDRRQYDPINASTERFEPWRS